MTDLDDDADDMFDYQPVKILNVPAFCEVLLDLFAETFSVTKDGQEMPLFKRQNLCTTVAEVAQLLREFTGGSFVITVRQADELIRTKLLSYELDSLCCRLAADGVLDVSWDDSTGQPVFRLSAEGEALAKEEGFKE